MNLKVGLTGNIGSGKSTVASILRWLGIPVFEADPEARKLFLREDVKTGIARMFGKVSGKDGAIDRKALATIVFSDPGKLALLNSLIHPLVEKQYLEFLEENKDASYTVFESAIIYESLFRDKFDKIITVSAPYEIISLRVMKRDGIPESEVLNRLKNQMDPEQKKSLADFVIYNDGKQLLLPQVLSVHYHMLNS